MVFAGFSAEALRSRINAGRSSPFLFSSCQSLIFSISAQAETVVTADEGVRGGKTIPLKATVDEAVEGCECVRRVIVATRTGANIPMVAERDLRLEEVMSECVL